MKNPHAVEGYRIFYHEVDGDSLDSVTVNDLPSKMSAAGTHRVDVKGTSANINGLKRDVVYELVVKAGNQYGELFFDILLKGFFLLSILLHVI